jgi:hypothetical protein
VLHLLQHVQVVCAQRLLQLLLQAPPSSAPR